MVGSVVKFTMRFMSKLKRRHKHMIAATGLSVFGLIFVLWEIPTDDVAESVVDQEPTVETVEQGTVADAVAAPESVVLSDETAASEDAGDSVVETTEQSSSEEPAERRDLEETETAPTESFLTVVAVDPDDPADPTAVSPGGTLRADWSLGQATEVSLSYSLDGGASFLALQDGYPATGMYIFRTPETEADSLVFKVSSTDGSETLVSSPLSILHYYEEPAAPPVKSPQNPRR